LAHRVASTTTSALRDFFLRESVPTLSCEMAIFSFGARRWSSAEVRSSTAVSSEYSKTFIDRRLARGGSWSAGSSGMRQSSGMPSSSESWRPKPTSVSVSRPCLLFSGSRRAIARFVRALHGTSHLIHAFIGLACASAFYLILALVYPAGIGWGDVKLSGLLGLYLGWIGPAALVIGLSAGFVLAAVAGVGLIVAGQATRKSQIAFGPFMLAGTLAVIACLGL